ncbi:MORN repeat-containing protein [Legionella longbeachae]|uniref:hypothetical protein n=1 Tax=Legionella longbeachae TaxID=450 RepID=UPI001243F629|nr:hypothetical protein [Legionella longbeachae]QEY50753.1 hypothetical protein FQU71_05535 [Legionella longbeachae]
MKFFNSTNQTSSGPNLARKKVSWFSKLLGCFFFAPPDDEQSTTYVDTRSFRSIPSKQSEYTYPDGGTYTGPISNNLPNGRGILKYQTHTIKGIFNNGKLPDPGSIEFSNGDFYEGNIVNGMPHGKGRYKDSKGNIYTGWFKNGEKDGSGTIEYKDKTSINGQFSNGQLNLINRIVLSREVNIENEIFKYKGPTLNGQLWGWGEITFSDSHVIGSIKGHFANGKLICKNHTHCMVADEHANQIKKDRQKIMGEVMKANQILDKFNLENEYNTFSGSVITDFLENSESNLDNVLTRMEISESLDYQTVARTRF